MENQVTATAEAAAQPGSFLKAGRRKGKSLMELAAEVTRINDSKRDFIVPVGKLEAVPNKSGSDVDLSFQNGKAHDFSLNNWSAGQVAGFTEIPKVYFDRLRSQNPALLADNINHGLRTIKKDDETNKRLVRTVDGHVRGFLSHRYRMLDANDLLEVVLPHLLDFQFNIVSSEITERRLYVKAETMRIKGEVKKGDVVNFGIMFSTSDVGAGSFRIEKYVGRCFCDNGAIGDEMINKRHLGGKFEKEMREVQEIMTTKTKQLSDAAFFSTVHDIMADAMKPEKFQGWLNKLQATAKNEIQNDDLEQVVELAMEATGISGQQTKSGILRALMSGNQGAGLTQWGLVNSFTAAAKMDHLGYDESTDLERAGGKIVELSKAQWSRIAEVAH